MNSEKGRRGLQKIQHKQTRTRVRVQRHVRGRRYTPFLLLAILSIKVCSLLPQTASRLSYSQETKQGPQTRIPKGTTRTNYSKYYYTQKLSHCQEIIRSESRSASQDQIKRSKDKSHKKMPDCVVCVFFPVWEIRLHCPLQQF